MVRCSPLELRTAQVAELKSHFTNLLIKNPLPKKPRNRDGPMSASGTSTPTQEQNRLVLARHAAVLGLGALVQAFPYQSPPPEWLPEVLATLAGKAASDPGMVGKSVKTALSDFKKTRQDTWHVDVKVCYKIRLMNDERNDRLLTILTGLPTRAARGSRGRVVEELLCLIDRLIDRSAVARTEKW